MADSAGREKAPRLSEAPMIAIVDDDRDMREALVDLLEVTGFSARTFDGAAGFLAAEATADFDLLVSDIRMSGMDGLELQEQLRARGSSIPVIFVTSGPDPLTRARAREGGAFACLAKPVGDDLLLSRIRAALGLDASPNG